MSFENIGHIEIGADLGLDEHTTETLFSEWKINAEQDIESVNNPEDSFKHYLLKMTEEDDPEEEDAGTPSGETVHDIMKSRYSGAVFEDETEQTNINSSIQHDDYEDEDEVAIESSIQHDDYEDEETDDYEDDDEEEEVDTYVSPSRTSASLFEAEDEEYAKVDDSPIERKPKNTFSIGQKIKLKKIVDDSAFEENEEQEKEEQEQEEPFSEGVSYKDTADCVYDSQKASTFMFSEKEEPRDVDASIPKSLLSLDKKVTVKKDPFSSKSASKKINSPVEFKSPRDFLERIKPTKVHNFATKVDVCKKESVLDRPSLAAPVPTRSAHATPVPTRSAHATPVPTRSVHATSSTSKADLRIHEKLTNHLIKEAHKVNSALTNKNMLIVLVPSTNISGNLVKKMQNDKNYRISMISSHILVPHGNIPEERVVGRPYRSISGKVVFWPEGSPRRLETKNRKSVKLGESKPVIRTPSGKNIKVVQLKDDVDFTYL